MSIYYSTSARAERLEPQVLSGRYSPDEEASVVTFRAIGWLDLSPSQGSVLTGNNIGFADNSRKQTVHKSVAKR